jgi:hypothetical protein
MDVVVNRKIRLLQLIKTPASSRLHYVLITYSGGVETEFLPSNVITSSKRDQLSCVFSVRRHPGVFMNITMREHDTFDN